MASDAYEAAVVEVEGAGLRLEPAAGLAVPEDPNDVNLLAIAVALALGRAGYEHHPEARDAEHQTLEALLTGATTMPWRRRDGAAVGHQVFCRRVPGSTAWTCRVDENS
jgi:hypothetical protein